MKNQHEIPGFINGKQESKASVVINVLGLIALACIGAALAAGV